MTLPRKTGATLITTCAEMKSVGIVLYTGNIMFDIMGGNGYLQLKY